MKNNNDNSSVQFANFPKKRIPLPPEYAVLYESSYKKNRKGETLASNLSQGVESWMHKKVAEDWSQKSFDQNTRTLEIGAGTLNQIAYEPPIGIYDIIEPMDFFYKDSPHLNRIHKIYADISEIPTSEKYDRITSVATFEHICDLPRVVERTTLLLKTGGSLRIGIPSEGGFLWGLGWRATTGLEFFLKNKLDYGVLMKHEHVNTAHEIESVIRHFYKNVKITNYGLGFHLSLYQFLECKLS